MTPTQVQSEKAAMVFAQLLGSYTNPPSQTKIDRMRKLLESQLSTMEVTMFGAIDAPDSILGSAMKKAGIPLSAVKDVILVSFESNDKIRYWFEKGWYER